MTTSGSYSFSVTRDDIIRQAMLNIGKLDPYESPDAQQTQDISIALNMMVKQWMGKADFAPGLKMWTRKHGHAFLQNNTGRYVLGPSSTTGWTNDYVYPTLATPAAASATTLVLSSISGMAVGNYIGVELDSGNLFWTTVATLPSTTITINTGLPSSAAAGNQVFAFATIAQQPLLIETASLRDIYSTDTPVKVMTVQSYDFLPNKADTTNLQDPTAVYYENQLGFGYLYTDAGAAQDVTKHLALTYMEPVQDFTTAQDTPYFPQEWYLPLCWGLAKLICPMFNRPWTQLMQDNFNSAMVMAKQKDAERSDLYFQPGAED